MNTVTIVIPIFNLINERKINFIRIIEYISDSDVPTIVVEQTGPTSSQDDILRIQKEKNKTNIKFLSVSIQSAKIHKSKLINEAAKHITSKYLWLLDADVFFKYNKVLELIDNQDVIKPFESVIKLTKEDTEYFLENKKIKFKSGDVKSQTYIFGPHSFIIKKEIFDKEGGMNEEFSGYGWEDIEFAERINDKYTITTFNSLNGLHLYHPTDRANSFGNKKLFMKLRGYDPEPDNSIPKPIKEKSVYVVEPNDFIEESIVDLSNLSLIIPVKIDTPDRLNNFEFCLKYLYTWFKNFELIVVEQSENPQLELICKQYGCEYIKRQISGTFHKTHNLNLAISVAKNEFAATYDCDVIFKPSAMKISLERLIDKKTNFIYPYNGYMLQLKKLFPKTTEKSYINALPYVQLYIDPLPEGIEVLYGREEYECTGGCFMFNRKELLLSGGYNTNIISYGCEDNEMETRLKMLDHKVERLKNYNCYHMEHDRSIDSTYNNYYQSNISEFCRIKDMSMDQLKTYIDRGFKNIEFNVDKNLVIKNDNDGFSIKTINKIGSSRKFDKSIKCSIVYTTYGRESQMSEDYMNRFMSWKTKEYEVIAVVHDETPLHRAYLQYCQRIGLIDKLIFCIPSHTHLRGVSLGAQYASSNIFMVINNDVKISKEAIDYCVDRLNSKENLGIIGWHYDFDENFEGTFWKNGKLEYSVRPYMNSMLEPMEIKNIKNSKWYTGKVFSSVQTRRILCCNGSFLCTKTNLWDAVGGMDPHIYYNYHADDYYCYGVLDLGYDIENIPMHMRMAKNKDIFECISDNKWKGIPTDSKGKDMLTYTMYGCLKKEECVVKLLADSYDNPNILFIGETKPDWLSVIDYKETVFQNEKIDILILADTISDVSIAKQFLNKDGCIVSTIKIDEEFSECGKIFVYFNNTKKEEYE